MEITKDFLVAEIQSLEQELTKANTFVIQAQATIVAYQMLINRLEAPSTDLGEQNGRCSNHTNNP
jgi:hypothetical protein